VTLVCGCACVSPQFQAISNNISVNNPLLVPSVLWHMFHCCTYLKIEIFSHMAALLPTSVDNSKLLSKVDFLLIYLFTLLLAVYKIFHCSISSLYLVLTDFILVTRDFNFPLLNEKWPN
jgi:hypothetical protein